MNHNHHLDPTSGLDALIRATVAEQGWGVTARFAVLTIITHRSFWYCLGAVGGASGAGSVLHSTGLL